MPKVFVAFPAFGNVNCTQTTASLVGLVQAFCGRGIQSVFATLSHPDIAELRNMFLTLWLDRSDATHLLFVDADMEFAPELVLDMLALDEPVVGTMYPKRTGSGFTGALVPNGKQRNGFAEAEGVGAGILLIRRDGVEAMIDNAEAGVDPRAATHCARATLSAIGITRIVRAFDPIETEAGEMSEDLSFCRRHRNGGGTVWANISHPVGHVGQHVFKGSYQSGVVR